MRQFTQEQPVWQHTSATRFETHPEGSLSHLQVALKLADYSSPETLQQVVTHFDEGTSPIGDMGGFTPQSRNVVAGINPARPISISRQQQTEVDSSISRLSSYFWMGDTEPSTRTVPNASLAFLTDVVTQQAAGHEWADRLGHVLTRLEGRDLQLAVADYAAADPERDAARPLLRKLMYNKTLEGRVATARYLAHQSLTTEQQQHDRYSSMLEGVKADAARVVARLALTHGLDAVHLQRTLGQIERVTMGAVNPLETNKGVLGYTPDSSLRVTIVPGASSDTFTGPAHLVMGHEVHHTGAAQTADRMRKGLYVAGYNRLLTEGFTELILQSAEPGAIERIANSEPRTDVAYPLTTRAIARVALNEPAVLGPLFRATYGQVDTPYILARSQETIYRQIIADLPSSSNISRRYEN